MKNLKFICVQPDDLYFTWQVKAWLKSLKDLNLSKDAIVLIFTPTFREFDEVKAHEWGKIESLYPESKFVYYLDSINISSLLQYYIPILRPYCLHRYFSDHPELQNDAIFYSDCDVYFTDKFKIPEEYIQDDINYLSNTNSYINASYFDSKRNDVMFSKLSEYDGIDVLEEATNIVGINRLVAELNNFNSGGAQYLLKNIDASFWEKMIKDAFEIRRYLTNINNKYFESESKGFQSWCADMWALLWGLWYRKFETKVIPEMDFSWGSDPIDKVENLGIYHNAGIVSDYDNGVPMFYKGKYHMGMNPFLDIDHLKKVMTNEESKKRGTYYYLDKLLKLENIKI